VGVFGGASEEGAAVGVSGVIFGAGGHWLAYLHSVVRHEGEGDVGAS
jgi:hypothetical protein